MTDITPIINALIALISAIIMIFVIPYIRTKTTESQREKLQAMIDIAVYAAEQLSKEHNTGEQKKDYVLGFLRERGLTYDEALINVMIEAAVKRLNLKQDAA